MEGIQEDFVGRLEAAPFFSDVAIIAMRKALTESEIAGKLGVLKGRAGKIGTCVMVQLPSLDVVDPNVPGPRTRVVQTCVVVEHPEHNAKSNGTGKTAEALAIAALQLFHFWVPYRVSQVFVGEKDAIVPDMSLDNMRAYSVTVTSFVGLRPQPKVQPPTIEQSTDVTLTCATAGASIYYTTDESYPSSANTAAVLYTMPFAAVSGQTIRAGAEKTDFQQSDIAQLTLT